MTNQTIPPCPVCGTVPEKHLFFNNAIHPKCKHLLYSREKSKHKYGELYITVERWRIRCTRALGRACRELGIETVEQLKARLATDPRVAVLEKKLAKLTDKLAMAEQESEQRLSAIIGYSDQLLAMKEKYEPWLQDGI